MIGFYDLIVGATALERGSQVATFNDRHLLKSEDSASSGKVGAREDLRYGFTPIAITTRHAFPGTFGFASS